MSALPSILGWLAALVATAVMLLILWFNTGPGGGET